MLNLALQLYINDILTAPDRISEPLVRAVINSLFSWRRAEPADRLPGNQKFGWWGDGTLTIFNDAWGSRLWELARSPLTDAIVLRAKGFVEEALAWLLEDGVAQTVEVQAERQGLDRLAIGCLIVRSDGSSLNIRFADVWKYLS